MPAYAPSLPQIVLSSEPTVTTGAAIRTTTLPMAAATGTLARGDVVLRRVRRRSTGSEGPAVSRCQ